MSAADSLQRAVTIAALCAAGATLLALLTAYTVLAWGDRRRARTHRVPVRHATRTLARDLTAARHALSRVVRRSPGRDALEALMQRLLARRTRALVGGDPR